MPPVSSKGTIPHSGLAGRLCRAAKRGYHHEQTILCFGLCLTLLLSPFVAVSGGKPESSSAGKTGIVSDSYTQYLEKQTVARAKAGQEIELGPEHLIQAEGSSVRRRTERFWSRRSSPSPCASAPGRGCII